MIVSALISELRREYGDTPKSIEVSRQGNGVINLFNLAYFPVVENSYIIYVSGVAKTETTHYTLDKDNGDLRIISTPANGIEVKSEHKYANWNDKNWTEAINQGIEGLNARGFFKQVVRDTSVFRISANVATYSGPTNAVDVYELLESDNSTSTGNFVETRRNWSYQQDANKIVFGAKPTVANYAAVSYLRNLQTYSATSATIDILNDWKEIIKKKAGAIYFRSLAGKIAQKGNANIDEGHFSFTNLRTMANDLDNEYERLAARKKPTRPAKDIQYNDPAGGKS